MVDKDHWSDEQLDELYKWSKQEKMYGLALSNPKFEVWLLLHFEDGDGVTAQNCETKLKKYYPNYDKGINAGLFDNDKIKAAIERAKKKDNPPCEDWPRHCGHTTVYRLVEKIITP